MSGLPPVPGGARTSGTSPNSYAGSRRSWDQGAHFGATSNTSMRCFANSPKQILRASSWRRADRRLRSGHPARRLRLRVMGRIWIGLSWTTRPWGKVCPRKSRDTYSITPRALATFAATTGNHAKGTERRSSHVPIRMPSIRQLMAVYTTMEKAEKAFGSMKVRPAPPEITLAPATAASTWLRGRPVASEMMRVSTARASTMIPTCTPGRNSVKAPQE